VKVAFFGSLGEAIGREVEFDAGQCRTVGDLRAAVAAHYPDAAGLIRHEAVRGLVGDRIVPEDFRLDGVDRVEFFPPLSGG
jgi:molybdopterin converting factor small subunit